MGLFDMFNTAKAATRPVEAPTVSGATKYAYKLNKARLDIRDTRDKVVTQIAKRDLLQKQKEAAENRKTEAEKQLGIFDLVQILLQKTSDYARQQAKGRIEEIVSQALNVVFGGTHKFIIELGLKANQPTAEYFLNDGMTLTKLEKPDYDRGGGKVDIISLALRLAIGELEDLDGPLFLDEVGKHVSKEYAQNVAFFLKEYSQQFNRQIILITHNSELAEIGEVSLEVTRQNGESEVKAV